MVALAVLAGLAKLIAEIVTKVSELTELGAVYVPFATLPVPCVIDQATCWSAVPVTDALNAVDCPAYT
jgi:hypothetical protein